MVRVCTGARLHFGFQNLSLARERLYGGVGVTLEEPCVVVEADPADDLVADPPIRAVAERSVSLLGVSGARVRLVEGLPRHVGLGSGTQHALATLVAIARAHETSVEVTDLAPALGRGGRSGVGVAAFESGGFVVDAGHPTERFTTAPPSVGEWTVPPVVARHDVPAEWRFLVVLPAGVTGEHGDREDEQIRSVVERADPAISDELATLLVHQLLPAIAEGNRERFGRAVGAFGRLNGAWYADEQGGVYRPPAGAIVEQLQKSTAVAGVGQSSWGPAVYGVTDTARASEAQQAATDALASLGIEGDVLVSGARNRGADVSGTSNE